MYIYPYIYIHIDLYIRMPGLSSTINNKNANVLALEVRLVEVAPHAPHGWLEGSIILGGCQGINGTS